RRWILRLLDGKVGRGDLSEEASQFFRRVVFRRRCAPVDHDAIGRALRIGKFEESWLLRGASQDPWSQQQAECHSCFPPSFTGPDVWMGGSGASFPCWTQPRAVTVSDMLSRSTLADSSLKFSIPQLPASKRSSAINAPSTPIGNRP